MMSQDDLETRVSVLQSHLESMMHCVQKNDALLRRFQVLETRLLTLSTLGELIEHVLADTQIVFELKSTVLLVCDPDQSIQKCLQEDGFPHLDYPELMLIPDRVTLQKVFGRSGQILMGQAKDCLPEAFCLEEQTPASVAMIPLQRRGEYLGCLVLGSSNAERFLPGMATDFLERLGQVLAVCLENTLHYEQLRRTTLNDSLTGVNNRRFYEQRLEEEVRRAIRHGDDLSCVFLDIDHFKQINDTWGHQTGDQALIHVAGLIRDQLRTTDVLARYGGEEFVALLPTANENKALEVAERIRRVVQVVPLKLADKQELDMTLSAGVATFSPAESGQFAIDGAELVGRADKALYQAKQAGRNQVVSGGVLRGKALTRSA